MKLDISETQKANVFLKLTGPCCEPKGLSPDGGLYRPTSGNPHQTGEPWHPSCHGGKTPAKPHVPLCPLPAFGGQSGVKGHCPLGEGRELADVAEAEMLQKTIRGGVKNGTA